MLYNAWLACKESKNMAQNDCTNIIVYTNLSKLLTSVILKLLTYLCREDGKKVTVLRWFCTDRMFTILGMKLGPCVYTPYEKFPLYSTLA